MARIAVRRLPIATISQLMGMTIDRHAARRIRGNLKLAGAANPRLGIPTLLDWVYRFSKIHERVNGGLLVITDYQRLTMIVLEISLLFLPL